MAASVNKEKISGNAGAVILWSRFVRWGLGLIFIGAGLFVEKNIPAIVFGVVLFTTGFLKPRRCIPEDQERSFIPRDQHLK